MATETGIPSQDTYANLKNPLSIISGGGGQSTFSTITASSLSVTGELVATYIQAAQISSIFIETEELACSTISTLSMVLDGNTLTSAGPELFLNGIALATTANLSSIGDWALDPAVSTVNMNGHPIITSAGYQGSGTVSTTDLQADTAAITRLVCSDISTNTLTAFSTIHVISTLSSLYVVADKGFIKSISSSDISTTTLTVDSTILVGGRVDALKMFAAAANFGDTYTSTLSTTALAVSSINGAQFPQVIPPQTVPSTLTGANTYVLADQGAFPATANANIRAQGGLGGNVNLRADPGTLGTSGGSIDLQAFGGNGLGGLYGAVRLTAYEGTDGTGFTTGGLIQLQANSGGALSNATSAIKFSGGSVVSYAGAANPIGSLYGYNYMYGTLGASVTASTGPPTANTPGTVYLYGDQGVVMGSAMYASRIYGYWNGLATPSNLFLSGRQTILGNSYVVLSNVQNMYMDNGAISGVNTINGATYPPPAPAVSPNLQLSTLTMNPTGYVSTVAIEGVSTLNGPAGFIRLDGDVVINSASGGGSLYLDSQDVVIIGGTSSELWVSSINNVSSINGTAYPPPYPAPPADLTVSSLTIASPAGLLTFTPGVDGLAGQIVGVSTINGAAYLPVAPPGPVSPDLLLSTLTMNPAGYISSAILTGVSTINGYDVNNPVVSSLTTAAIRGIDGSDLAITTGKNLIELRAGAAGNQGVVQINPDGYIAINSVGSAAPLTNGAGISISPEAVALSFPQDPTNTFGVGQIENLSTINGVAYVPAGSVSANLTVSTLTVGAGLLRFTPGVDGNIGEITGLSSINGELYPPAPGNVADWATFPAVQNVDMAGFNITNASTMTVATVSTLSIVGATNTFTNFGQATAGAINMYHDTNPNGAVNILVSGTGAPGRLKAGYISTNTFETSSINGQSINNLIFSSIAVSQTISTPIISWDASIARLDGGNITLANTNVGGRTRIYNTNTDTGQGTLEVGSIENGATTGASTISMDLGQTTGGLLDIRAGAVQVLTPGSGPGQLNVSLVSTTEIRGLSTINGVPIYAPIVSSITFASPVLQDKQGVIYLDSGLIFYNKDEANPALDFTFSTINNVIEPGVNANEIAMNQPEGGATGNNLTLHVSNTDISINANVISAGYAPAPMSINASAVYMSSLYTSSINGAGTGVSEINVGGIGTTGAITLEGAKGITVATGPTQTISVANTGGGFYVNTASVNQPISIPGLTATGLVMATYYASDILTNGIVSVVPTTDVCIVSLLVAPVSDGRIIWQVVDFGV